MPRGVTCGEIGTVAKIAATNMRPMTERGFMIETPLTRVVQAANNVSDLVMNVNATWVQKYPVCVRAEKFMARSIELAENCPGPRRSAFTSGDDCVASAAGHARMRGK
jgi:hypothetical protein